MRAAGEGPTYGAPNIRRFADGWLLLRMSALGAGRLFFTA